MVLASDDNDSVNGDTNRGNLLAMLKLMAKMQHNISPQSPNYIIDVIAWLRSYPRVTSTESQWGQILRNHE